MKDKSQKLFKGFPIKNSLIEDFFTTVSKAIQNQFDFTYTTNDIFFLTIVRKNVFQEMV